MQNQSTGAIHNAINILSAISNVINSIIGVGIATLPMAIKLGGVYFGLATSFFCCVLIYYTSDLQIRSKKRLEEKGIEINTYAALCKETLGSWAFFLLATITFLMMFFAMGVYAVILRQMTSAIIGDFLGRKFLQDKLLLLGIMACVFLLCIPRDVSVLGYFSFLSTLLVVSFVVITQVQSPVYHELMSNLDQAKMVRNEKKLDLERAEWICDKAVSENSLYGTDEPEFPFHHAKNYAALYSFLESSSDCKKRATTEILEAVKSFNGVIQFEPSAGRTGLEQPSDWSQVVQQAHAADLFSTYSLNANKGYSITASGLLSTIGTYSSAFIIQQATFGIFESMNTKTVRMWRVILGVGMVLVYILCMWLGLAGYLAQGHQVGEIVFSKMKLRYFEDSGRIDITTNVARIFLVATIVLTFPMQHWFAKRNFNIVFFHFLSNITGVDYDPIHPPKRFYYPITFAIFAGDLLVGLFSDSVFTIYALLGSLCASSIIYILPCLSYLSLDNNILVTIKKSFGGGLKKILASGVIPLFTCVFGVVCLFVSTAMTIYNEFL